MKLNIQRFNGTTGYDAHAINQVITSVKVAYENFYRAFENDTRSTVEEMSGLWESGNAQTFFKTVFKPETQELVNGAGGLNNCVRSIISSIANAGNNWAARIGNGSVDHFSNEFTAQTLDVDVESIKDHFDDGSTAGAMTDLARDCIDSRTRTMSNDVEACCDQLKDAVSAAAFLDAEGFQSESLISAIETVNGSFNEAISSISDRMINGVNNEMDVTETQARNTEFTVE